MKATPEPGGVRIAYCKHCDEMIRRERTGLPWYHVDGETEKC